MSSPSDDRTAEPYAPPRPEPLSFGAPAVPDGPLVSPAIAAYRPASTSWQSHEPPTGPISAEPPTGQITAVPPTPPVATEPPTRPIAAEPPTGPIAAEPPTGPLWAGPPPGLPTMARAHPVPQPPAPTRYPLPPAPPPYQPYPPRYPGYAYYVDPATGRPLSDRTKVAAGLMQLLFALFLALGGIGRLYAGQSALGASQLVLSVVGWTAFAVGFLTGGLTWLFSLALWIFFIIDGIVVLAGRPVDGQGRLLR